MGGESGRETYALYVTWMVRGNPLYGSGSSARGSVSTLRGGMGRRWEGVHEGQNVCKPTADSC